MTMTFRTSKLDTFEYGLSTEMPDSLSGYFEVVFKRHMRLYGVAVLDRFSRPIDNKVLLEYIHRQEWRLHKRRPAELNRLPQRYINFLTRTYDKKENEEKPC